MAGMLVTAGCPEVLGVMPLNLKKARRPRDVSIASYREPPPSFYGERISRQTSGYDDDPRELFEIEEVTVRKGGAIFDTAVLLRDVGITGGAGITRNQDAGVNMNKRESFSIAACSSFGRAAIWS